MLSCPMPDQQLPASPQAQAVISDARLVLPLLQELLTCRTWDASRHPQWLVFEVEGRLQIRPNQHALARTLLAGGLDEHGPIAQLNMGEGKTRVILPMLILELANGDNLVRVPQCCWKGKQTQAVCCQQHNPLEPPLCASSAFNYVSD